VTTTLDVLQSGSATIKWTVCIEGIKEVLSDAPTAAVQAAYAGTGYDDSGVSVLGGLFVDLRNKQAISAWEPFPESGSCVLSIVDADGTDYFGTLVHRRNAGTETEITSTIGRSDTTINVKSTTGFPSSGTIYVGTETIKYSGVTTTSFTGATRGMFAPFECASSGSGGARFANHHRCAADSNHVQIAPLATTLPRTWIGRRVSVRLHTWDEATQTLNTRDEAQLVFAGRIAGIADDPNTFATQIDLEHIAEEIRNGVIGRDLWDANIAKGIWIAAGRYFRLIDISDGTSRLSNDLVVVTSGASGTNQMDQGFYSLGEIVERFNTWLAAEYTAARIWGNYHWRSPVSNADGLRTVIDCKIPNASSGKYVNFTFYAPAEIVAFLGMIKDIEPAQDGSIVGIPGGSGHVSNVTFQICGASVPFSTVIFRPTGPGRLAQEFTEAINYELENERGEFTDQRDYLPANVKGSCPAGHNWGLFVLDEKVLMVGSYDSTNHWLTNCWLAPFQLVADNSSEPMSYIGRRVDEPDEPVRVRQIFVLETTLEMLVNLIVYSTGTAGYNHDAYDSFGYALGLGIPGEILGHEFERSLTNLPGANAPIVVVIDEPTKLSEIVSGDFLFRNAFLRWKDQHFEFAQWRTPTLAESVATFSESNKAAPAGHQENHRIASQESAEAARQVVKLDYARDFASTRDDNYLRSLKVEDQTAVDDAGGNIKPYTIRLRNTYAQFTAAGSAVEALLPNFVAAMPLRSRASRAMTRSLDLRYFEGYAPGDVITVSDEFARDPVTGRRGIGARPAMITRISYSLGGPSPGGGDVAPIGGDVDLLFLDVHRGELYCPSAQIDDTANTGGFTAGYDSGSNTIRTISHQFSHVLTLPTHRSRGGGSLDITEALDASNFSVGDHILIIEIDPDDETAPLYWETTVDSVSGTDIAVSADLSGFDTSKRYRVTYQKLSQVTTTQQDYAYQASDTTLLIENLDPPDHFSSTLERFGFTPNTGDEQGEIIPEMLFGDGRAWDVGTDRALINSYTRYLDGKSCKQNPIMWTQSEFGTSNPTYVVCWMGPVFFGTEQLSSTIRRVLRIAPLMRSNTGGTTGYIRATLSRIPPQPAPAISPSLQATAGVRFLDHYSQAEWTTTSSTYALGTEAELEIGVKDQTTGIAWLVIERKGTAEVRGIGKFIESERVVL
jgi:hypothetical protein